ncbi:hypothetical protein [Reyranella sp.]|uniref:hypothetical protein n=1 Tax=Reyranella sp. TaxID=1929291 RepID=UPI003D0DB805
MDPDHAAGAHSGRIHHPDGGEDFWEVFHPVGGSWPRGEIARWLLDAARHHYARARGTQ